MSGATDSGMVKTMGYVLAALAVLAFACVTAARLLGVGNEDFSDPLKRNALIQRIQPVASVRISTDDLPAAEAPQEVMAVASAPKSAEELAGGVCASCHAQGVAGAPKIGDETEWAVRREAGLDALIASVVNGKGNMPAGGGSAYSADEIKLAVQYMAGFDVDDSAAAAEASTEVASTDEAASTGSDEAAAAPVTGVVAAAVVGQVPDGLTDNIKASVDGVCAGCHISGVGNAPKLGDTEAWQLRADKGMEALTSSVINGLNVMPARGGSTLSDEEIPIAIQYLMSK